MGQAAGWRQFVRVGREGAWLMAGQAAAVLGGLFSVRVITSILAPEAYGRLALGMTVVSLLQQTAFAGLGGAAMRFLSPAVEKLEIRSFFLGLTRVTAGRASFAMAGAVVVLGIAYSLGERHWSGLGVAAVAFGVGLNLAAVFDGLQNAARRRAVVAWHQGAAPWLRLLSAVVVMAFFPTPTASAALSGYALGALLIVASHTCVFRRTFGPDLRKAPQNTPGSAAEWARRIRQFSLPFALWGIPCWLQMASARWSLQSLASTTDVGFYAVLYQLGYQPMVILTGIGMQLAMPILFQHYGAGDDPVRTRKASRLTILLVVGTAACIAVPFVLAWCLHRQVFTLLVAVEYRDASSLLPMMILAGGLFAVGQMASILLMGTTDTRRLLYPKVGSSVIGMLLNIGGAWGWGIRGVVWAEVLFALTYTVWILAASLGGSTPSSMPPEEP